MSSVQRQREALGHRLRQLRKDARLTNRALAAKLKWPPSKVSKLENGQQTPTRDDIEAWCKALDEGHTVADLVDRLADLKSLYSEYRDRYRLGARSVQIVLGDLEAGTETFRVVETAVVPGLLQTPDYARSLLSEAIDFNDGADDLDAAVAQRMARQSILYDSHRRFHVVVSEAVLWHRVATVDVMAAQIDRLGMLTAARQVRLGIVPFSATWRLSPAHAFWIYDDTTVVVETIAADVTLTQPDEIATYVRAFEAYAGSAVYGAPARRILTEALVKLDESPE